MSADKAERRLAEEAAKQKRGEVFNDLALTLPIFVLYHLGVAVLPIRNAADPVTAELRALASNSLPTYVGITLALGAIFGSLLVVLGKRETLSSKRFLLVAVEGTLYAVLMRVAGSYAVGAMRLAPAGGDGPFEGLVMSLGAGFYEEVVFRAGLFGLGALALARLFPEGSKRLVSTVIWAASAACIFSGWHYVGALGDPFEVQSFVFRAVCGLLLTLIFAVRGFAPAVWTHALYDIWVLVL